MVVRVDPAVADEEPFEASGDSARSEDGLRDVRDVLASVRLAGDVRLQERRGTERCW